MREILFRGKTESGCWTRGSLSMCSEPGKVEILYPVDFEDEDGNVTPSFDYAEVIPETVGQFTGLLDKNGKKIFEGDVVQYPEPRKRYDVPIIIYYENGSFMYRPTCKLWSNNTAPINDVSYYLDVEDLEVIGNIHDNPELLEE